MTDKTPAVHEALAVYAPETVEIDRVPPGYKQTEVGMIPDDWETVSIGAIAKFTSGVLIKTSALHRQSPQFPVPVFGGNGVAGYTNDAVATTPTVVIGRVGQKCGSVYRTGGPAWITDNALYPKQVYRAIDVDFLALALEGARLNEVRNQNDLPLVTQSIVHDVLIAIPKLTAEQRAIATALSDVDALISGLDKLIAKKRAVKTAAMQQLLIGKQRLPGFSGEWEAKRFGDVVERIVGGGTPSRSNPAYWGGEIPWMTVKDFANFDPYRAQETITEEGLKHSASHLIPKGIIIMSTRMALGKAVIYEVDVSINQDLKAIFPKRDMDSRFLYFWFEHHAEMIESLGSGSTVKGISLQDLRRVKFLKAPLKEQTAIAAVLSDMDAEISALEGRREKTRRIKQGMMQELLTGRTRLV